MNVTIPTSWKSVTIKQFIELYTVKSMELDSLELILKIVSIMTGLTHDQVNSISLPDIRKIAEKLSFIETFPESDTIESIEIDKKLYVANWDISKITAGQYLDIKEFAKVDPIGNLHCLMAAIYTPYGEEYGDSIIMDRADLFYEKMPVSTAYPMAVFFCNLLNASMPIIQDYLIQENEKKIQKIIHDMQQS